MPKDTQSRVGLSITLGQFSTEGRKPENQDFHGAMIPTGAELALKGIAVAIADGISTSSVSREAAELGVAAMLTDYYATSAAWTVETAARSVITATNSWLYARNRALSNIETGHVATLSALVLKGRKAYIFHVGDCRIARVAGGSLEPLTKDHCSPNPEGGNYLSRALGLSDELEIDYRAIAVRPGDIFVLSSDGVHEVLNPNALAEIARSHEPELAASTIAATALELGSTDNITVQVLRIEQLPEAETAFAPADGALPVPALPKAGEELDGFRIIRPLQSSARSHVFLAETPLGQRAVIKIPATDTASDPDYIRRFAMEDWVARRICSPHVVKAVLPPDGRSALYSASEFIDGITLRQWMTDHPRPEFDEIRKIADQIGNGLRALHRRQMIHQDLRPENIMVDRDGTVKIIDLGSALVAGVEEAAPGLLGELPGTYQYTAPEYFSGDVVSWRSDQYALAVVVYELMTGRLPYGAQVAKVRSRTDQKRLSYQPARDDRTGVPAWVDAALARACHPDPLRRYDALSEFLADLRRPAQGWQARRHRPLAERDPLRFWQTLSVLLALALVLALATRH